MKSTVLKWYMFAFLFLSEFIMFAQPADEAENEGDQPLEGDDTPINSKLIILAVIAIVFSVYYFKRSKSVVAN